MRATRKGTFFFPEFALTAARYYYCRMTKTETSILESKTPEDYIDRSLKARLSPAAKAKLAQALDGVDGLYERGYPAGPQPPPLLEAQEDGRLGRAHAQAPRRPRLFRRRLRAMGLALVTEFLGLNRRGPDGRYEQKDWQLAERFGATIPSIQYMRRKLSKVEGLLGARASPRQDSRVPPARRVGALARQGGRRGAQGIWQGEGKRRQEARREG